MDQPERPQTPNAVSRRTPAKRPIVPQDLSHAWSCGQPGCVHKRGCHAHKTNGLPCGQPPIKGGRVCRTHGGSAPQVRAAAERRLATLVSPSISTLDLALRKRSSRDALPMLPLAVKVAQTVLEGHGYLQEGKKGSVVPFTPPAAPGTATTTITVSRTESLTDDELDTMQRLLEKLGVNPETVIDVPAALPPGPETAK